MDSRLGRPDARSREEVRLEFEAAFCIEVSSCHVVSFDVFDTALFRHVGHPTDVFELVAETAAIEGLQISDFRQRRIEAEARARRHNWNARQLPEVSLADIYNAFDPPLLHEEIDRLITLELQQERSVSYANPEAMALYGMARRLGKRVVFVSDMYLPASFVRELVERAGYEAHDGVWVSSQHGTNKGQGDLFRLMAAALHVSLTHVLHLGDNFAADVAGARATGARALHYVPPLSRPIESRSTQLAEHHSHWRKQVLADRLQDVTSEAGLIGQMGYCYGAPFFLGFVEWIASHLEGSDVRQVYFCARDGWVLHEVYDLVRATLRPALPPAQYLFVSRRALCFPAIDSLSDEMGTFLTSGTQKTAAVHEFIARIGLRVDASVERAARDAGFRGLDDVVAGPSEYVKLQKLFERLETRILERVRSERRLLHRYLERTGMLDGGSVAIVDLGWHANLQRALLKTLADAHSTTTVRGFYVGLFSAADRNLRNGVVAQSYLCGPDSSAEVQQELQGGVPLLELLHQGPHPGVQSFAEGASGVVPTFRTNGLEVQQRRLVRRFQTAAIAGVKDWLSTNTSSRSPILDEQIAREAISHLLFHPSAEVAEVLGELYHFDGVSHDSGGRKLADVSAVVDGSDSVSGAFQSAYWRAGFLRRLESRLDSLDELTRRDAEALFQSPSSDRHSQWDVAAERILTIATQHGIHRAVVYGAGEFGLTLLKASRGTGVEVLAFVDGSSAIQGTTLGGLPVLSLHDGLAAGHRAFLIGSLASIAPIEGAIRRQCESFDVNPLIVSAATK